MSVFVYTCVLCLYVYLAYLSHVCTCVFYVVCGSVVHVYEDVVGHKCLHACIRMCAYVSVSPRVDMYVPPQRVGAPQRACTCLFSLTVRSWAGAWMGFRVASGRALCSDLCR